MKDIILQILEDSLRVKEQFIRNNTDLILKAAHTISDAIENGHKILLFGNGGSAADAQHLAAEFVNRFQVERPPLPAIALTTDTSIITSIGNDYHFDEIFSKQIMALGQKGDVAIAISTSGNSKNVIKAVEIAKKMGIIIIGLTGGQGGQLADMADMGFCVESSVTARIQETHITIGHIFCDLTDRILMSNGFIPSQQKNFYAILY
jgi:D-sedoheptulose 7-phosphate isomerase